MSERAKTGSPRQLFYGHCKVKQFLAGSYTPNPSCNHALQPGMAPYRGVHSLAPFSHPSRRVNKGVCAVSAVSRHFASQITYGLCNHTVRIRV